jgi:hypothetical protein
MQLLIGCIMVRQDDLVCMTGSQCRTSRSTGIWFRRCCIHLSRVAAAFGALVCVSEFLLHLLPCFVLVVLDPFMCLVVVGLYQGEVGFFYEFRHYPVLFLIAVGVVAWCARRDRRERANATVSRT